MYHFSLKKYRHKKNLTKNKNKHYSKIGKLYKTSKYSKNKIYKNSKYIKKMRGGYGPGSLPVGYNLEIGNTQTWPGVAGFSQGMGNHYSLSNVGIPSRTINPPITSNNLLGGKKYKKKTYKRKKFRGGNILDTIKYNFQELSNKFNGNPDIPINPSVAEQPINKDFFHYIKTNTTNIKSFINEADNNVANV